MQDATDDALLALVDQALETESLTAPVPAPLLPPYFQSLDKLYRRSTRLSLAIFTLVFDLFLVSQIRASPELVPLSAVLRLGVYTPAVLAFLALDRPSRPMPRRQYEFALAALAVAPGVLSAILCVHTTSFNSISDVRATTLILLVVGLIYRMRLPFATVTAIISCAAYFTGLALTPVIPRAEIPSIVLTELSIATAVIVFTALLDRRDRLLFLLNLREQIRARSLNAINQRLRRKADKDALTGLANRGCFDATLTSAMQAARLAGEPISLILIDIDHFKRFNDHYGHQGGDDCLRRVAHQMQRDIRDNNLLARYGGEEFVVILPECGLQPAMRIAERLRTAIAELAMPHEGVGPGTIVSISLGVGTASSGQMTRENLIEIADQNLYAAKRAGRNRVMPTVLEIDPSKKAGGGVRRTHSRDAPSTPIGA